MTRFRSRISASAVLALAVATPSPAADVHPLLPAETEQVIYVNFRQIIDSQLVRRYALEQMKQSLQAEAAQKVMTDLGLDPLKDVDELTAGFWAEDPKAPKGIVVLSGKFDPVKLFNAADVQSKKTPEKIEIVAEGKYKFVRVVVGNPDETNPNPGMPFKELYFSLPSDSMILASTEKELLAKTMGRVEKKDTKPMVRKPLGALITNMDGKASFYTCSLNDPNKVGDIPPNPIFDDTVALKKQIQNVETTAMTVRVGEDVGLELILGMKDTTSADEFGGTVDGALDKVKSFLPLLGGQPKFKPFVDDLSKNLKSKTKGKEIHVTVVISGKAIATIAGAPDCGD